VLSRGQFPVACAVEWLVDLELNSTAYGELGRPRSKMALDLPRRRPYPVNNHHSRKEGTTR
jgi:hypothetical protein